MYKYFVFFIVLLGAVVYAEDGFEASKEHILDKRQNYFLISSLRLKYRTTPEVNPITGEYCEEELDLVVAGSEPVSVRRFYNSSAPYDPRYATWRYNPETFLVANLEWQGQDVFAAIGDTDGSVCSLKPSAKLPNIFDFQPPKHYAASSSDGTSHPLNTKIKYWRSPDPKDKFRFQYMCIITDGSGRERTFVSPMHRWTYFVHWIEKTTYSEKTWRVLPNTWTPYHIPIVEEKLPNGNILSYTYTPWKEEKQKYPLPQLLGSITAYNADKSQMLGYIQFHYPRDKHGEVAGVQVVGSDGRAAFMQHTGKSPIKLASAQRAGQPFTAYASHNTILNTIAKPDGRVTTVEYNSEGKVIAKHAPVGPNEEMCPISRYEYQDKLTIFHDAENKKLHYRYDDNKKLASIETFEGNTLYRIERFSWDATTGNLMRKAIEDSAGNPIHITEYQYDKNHNPIVEKTGDGKQWRTIERTYSDDGFNLKLTETDRQDKLTKYSYVPGTNLLASEIIYSDNIPKKRTFHFYDNCAICIKTIIDDGSTENPNNLKGVTYRTITYITPKKTLPCFGLPEIIEEKTIDASGTEILLKKTAYTYTPFGKILKEEHYDAANAYRYSIINTYDDQERLIGEKDPLDHQKTFAYDANFNLTSIQSPQSHQEITYDKANRPVRIADWQTDATILITERRYDKLGRLIEETDACGQKTQFHYDALSRLTATIHPDGAITQKEYDLLDNPIKETDPKGYITQKTYNCFGQILEITYPDGSTELFTYHPTGTLATHQDKNGALSSYTYDLFDHLLKEEVFSSEDVHLYSKTAIYSPFCKLSETDEEGIRTVYTYDFAGRKTSETKAGHVTFYAYDACGRLFRIQKGETVFIKEYDLLDRLVEQRTEEGICTFQEKYAYDAEGNQTQVITCSGITETLYNAQKLPIQITDPDGRVTKIAYTYSGEFTKTTLDPDGIQKIESHDPCRRLKSVQILNPQRKTIQYREFAYDLGGNQTHVLEHVHEGTIPVKTIHNTWTFGPGNRLETLIESDLKKTSYLYDTQGRLVTIIKPDQTQIQHTYDSLGRLKTFKANQVDYTYTYDKKGRILSVSDAIHGTATLRSYDPLDNMLEEKLANGLRLKYNYDPQGRLTSVIFPDNTAATFTYIADKLYQITYKGQTTTYSGRDLSGKITLVTLPANLGTICFTYDSCSRLKSSVSPYFTALDYQYDPTGHLVHYTFTDPLGPVTADFTYDDLHQLVSENEHTYAYDSLNNRIYKDELRHSHNALSQITHDGKTSYLYDPNGNLIQADDTVYAYDGLNRLISVTSGGKTYTYTYDSFNRRITKKTPTQTIQYLWQGKNEIGSSEGELRILGEGLGAEIGAAAFIQLQNTLCVPFHDQRGALVTLVDIKGNALETIRYTAYGEELTSTSLSPWRFCSKRLDPETNNYYFGQRYYSPLIGRFITQDPQGFEDGPNLYAYLKNCPMTDFDLYGLFGWRGMWGGTKDFFCGAGSYAWDGMRNFGSGIAKMGEWMHADFQYEYFGDRSFFQNKSSRAVDEWKTLSKVALDNPLNLVVPGIMEAWRNPTSPRAWGKAAVDTAIIGFSIAKINRTASNLGRIGEEFATSEKILATTRCETFFDGAKYSSKVSRQMSKTNDIYHAFPTSVDGFATKFGTWSTKIGSDGKTYQWLEMHGSYKGKIGVFEFIKDEKNIINHRYFKTY